MNEQLKFLEAIKINHLKLVKDLLNNDNVNPAKNNNVALQWASQKAHYDIVELLIKDPRINPADRKNLVIIDAYQRKNIHLVNLYWADYRVRDSLQIDNIDLYNKLMKDDIKNKLKGF